MFKELVVKQDVELRYTTALFSSSLYFAMLFPLLFFLLFSCNFFLFSHFRFESGNVKQEEGTKPAPAPRISDIAKKFAEKPPAPQPPPPSKIAAISKKFEAAKKPAKGANTAAISKTFEQPLEKTKKLKKPVVWGTPPRKKPISLPSSSSSTGGSGSANQTFNAVQHFNKAAAPAPPPNKRTASIANKFAAPNPPSAKSGARGKKAPAAATKPKPQHQAPPHSPEKANYVPPADSIEASNQANVSDMTKKWSQPPSEYVKKEGVDDVVDWGVIRMVYSKKGKGECPFHLSKWYISIYM
jgi:hypothetical protein